jgi:hypothetical protein
MKPLLFHNKYHPVKWDQSWDRWATMVDDEDFERFKDSKWYLTASGYVIRNAGFGRKGQHTEMLHQLIMGKSPKGYVIDHINRNPLDNRRANLRAF